jgi:hypothetical protein
MTRASTEKKQLAWITAGAVAVFLVMRFLPTGTNLNHMDFRVTAKNSIEFCDPLNPQFIPVVAVASPVTMTLTSVGAPPTVGKISRFMLTLKTASGKAIAPEDLVVTHTMLLHMLITDPTLTDYQHVHPEPSRTRGEWLFSFTPRLNGTYRVFADFTPVATGRGLYASADVPTTGAVFMQSLPPPLAWTSERGGYRFDLMPGALPIRAGQPADLKLLITRAEGGAVPMEPVMGAFAHLVAFDEARSGFAHLHPMEAGLDQRLDATRPELHFKVTIPRAGRYVIWAQVNLGGRETFAPFWFDVVE